MELPVSCPRMKGLGPMETPGEGRRGLFSFFFFFSKKYFSKEKFAFQRQYCAFSKLTLPSLPLWA